MEKRISCLNRKGSTKLNCFIHTLFVGLEIYLCAFFSFENKLPVGFGNISELSSETL